jgi:hypothetical protein
LGYPGVTASDHDPADRRSRGEQVATAQEIIIRGKFVAPSASAAAAHYLPVVSIAIAYDPHTRPKRSAQTL